MTSSTGRTGRKRAALLAGGVALAATLALVVWRRPPRAPAPAAHATSTPPPAPFRSRRRDFPSVSDPIAAAREAAPRPSQPAALAVAPPPQTVIHVGDDRPVPSAQTGGGWATDYRDAVCACSTRACVRDLQSSFIRKLGGVTYSNERDEETYSAAVRGALRCYGALPEDS